MKREDTIKLYLEEFLAGRSEQAREKFLAKDINKQYGSIMAWKHRKNLSTPRKAAVVPTTHLVLDAMKKARKTLANLENPTEKELARIRTAAEELINDVNNFERVKKNQLLLQLESEQKKMARQTEEIAKQIAALRQEISE